MLQSWRWFGENDVVPLASIAQAGAIGVVSALHDIPYGEVWSYESIIKRQKLIASQKGLHWAVVESLPIHEKIKLGEGDLTKLFDNYRASMRNLAKAGIKTICYNFMPVIDWARTQLKEPLPHGGFALKFNAHEFAAFDCFMLEREGARKDWSNEVITKAENWFKKSSQHQRDTLLASIMAGLPGAFDRYDIAGLKIMLARYDGFTAEKLCNNLIHFLNEVIPLAEELGMRFAIHPDDPPFSLMGLPRIISSSEDLEKLFKAVPSIANGLTLCTGSLGAGAHNDVPLITQHLAERIHFVHLRNTIREPDGSFMEADHLGGDTDMISVIDILLAEQTRRKLQGRNDWQMPFRPDHGHELMDDIGKNSFPGYSAIGRLKGLAELRGVMLTLAKIKGYEI